MITTLTIFKIWSLLQFKMQIKKLLNYFQGRPLQDPSTADIPDDGAEELPHERSSVIDIFHAALWLNVVYLGRSPTDTREYWSHSTLAEDTWSSKETVLGPIPFSLCVGRKFL